MSDDELPMSPEVLDHLIEKMKRDILRLERLMDAAAYLTIGLTVVFIYVTERTGNWYAIPAQVIVVGWMIVHLRYFRRLRNLQSWREERDDL